MELLYLVHGEVEWLLEDRVGPLMKRASVRVREVLLLSKQLLFDILLLLVVLLGLGFLFVWVREDLPSGRFYGYFRFVIEHVENLVTLLCAALDLDFYVLTKVLAEVCRLALLRLGFTLGLVVVESRFKVLLLFEGCIQLGVYQFLAMSGVI